MMSRSPTIGNSKTNPSEAARLLSRWLTEKNDLSYDIHIVPTDSNAIVPANCFRAREDDAAAQQG